MRAPLVLAALLIASAAASGAANAASLTDRAACLANGNSAEACDCLESYVRDKASRAKGAPSATVEAVKKGEASPGSSADDLSAMGIVMQATADGAKACNIKSKK